MTRLAFATVLALLVVADAFAAPVPLPAGQVALGDLGIYQVGYQSYGGQPVLMPPSYLGHFVDPSGISYLPGERANGRRAILLHSPWRVAPGRAWVDYPVQLPNLKPISLSFGVAIGEAFAVPGRSDGVTFSAFTLSGGGAPKELFREHQATAEWHDKRFDLSEFAGQALTIRLQVEPGPANDASWDYSYFGDAKLTIGDARESRADELQSWLTSRAYRATSGVALTKLANASDQGVTPGNLLACRNAVKADGPAFLLTYEGADCRLTYRYAPATGTLDDLTAQLDALPAFQPAGGGRLTGVIKRDGKEQTVPLTGGKALAVTPDAKTNTLVVDWAYPLGDETVTVNWVFGVRGKALTVHVRCLSPVLSGLSLGHVANAALRRTVGVPYLPPVWGQGLLEYLPAHRAFVCRYLDWTYSHASTCPQGEATYEPKTDGTRNPLGESGYVAVSPSVAEVLPNIPHPPSPYRKLLGDRVMLDIWGHHHGTYAGDAENLRALKDLGVDHVAIIQHVWQRYGYDVKLPDHIPANPQFGGDEGMIAFGQAANECGYVWSVHENYIDLYPDAPSYDPTARVLTAAGEPSKAWFNGSVQSFGLKCTRALGYAKQNSPVIHRTYKTTAAYLDVHTCVPPWHQLDHEASIPGAAMAHTKVDCDGALFQYMRDTHEGPLFGEGANQFYWAGKCDGVEAQVGGGENHVPFLDLDLLKIHPQMTNHGMGYYERWFTGGYDHSWGVDSGTPEQVDKYRAQELAYGHAGFIGSAQTDNLQWVAREHHLMHPVQRLYGTAQASEISYEVEGKLVPGSVALALGDTWRQRVKYDSGLSLWVNWRAEPWKIGATTLPQWGFLAQGPDTLAYTALRDGKFADYAECPEYFFADARTRFNMPYLRGSVDITPRLKDFAYLGGNKVRLTYEWEINDTLAEDCHCFVHFVDPSAAQTEKIAFQQDHTLPKPTPQWRKGERLVDGPYEVTVPAGADTYLITIGLFNGPRVPLRGPCYGGNRILLGVLKVKREGDRITDVSLGDLPEAVAKYTRPLADFTAHLNPPGTLVDFGKIVTDGAVKINRAPRQLVIIPVPRDAPCSVRLKLQALAPQAPASGVKVQMLATGTQAPLGAAPFQYADGWLTLKLGRPGVGRYVVSW